MPDTTPAAGMSETKTCTKCGEVKALGEFAKDAQRRSGRRASCKKCHQIADAPWRAANRERRRAEDAAWRAANAERQRANAAAWYASNRERKRSSCAAWYAANRERKLAVDRAWRAAHPEVRQVADVKRRALKANAPVVERIYRAVVWERDGGRCHICGKKADPNNWHLEHIVPLSAGGEHSYRNVAVSHPACNLRKGVRGPGQMRLVA